MTSKEYYSKQLSYLTVSADPNKASKVSSFMREGLLDILRDLMEDYMSMAETNEERQQVEGVTRVIRDFRAMNEYTNLRLKEQK